MNKHELNFRKFMEDYTSPGSFRSDQIQSIDIGGKTHPEISLEFPTVTKRGEVFSVSVQGKNYNIQISHGTTIIVPRDKYHKKYNRLPKTRRKDQGGQWLSGDMITAVFYKHKERGDENYKLKSFEIDSIR